MKRDAFTLIEILVVIAIMGLMSAMVVPAYKNTIRSSEANLNKVAMQNIKKASLAFKNDVGFVPDNVALLIFPYEECTVLEKNFNEDSSTFTCRAMIAFIDSRMTRDDYRISGGVDGDGGADMRREPVLIAEIQKRLNPKEKGWSGSYLGGNTHLKSSHIKKMGGSSNIKDNSYFLSTRDIEIYYEGFMPDAKLADVGVTKTEAEKWFCVESKFGIDLDDIAKYRKNLAGEPNIREGELTILDQWGTPYEIQFPSQSNIDATYGAGKKSRERFARIVSFGEDKQRDTIASNLDINYKADGYDDSVLYIYEHNQTNYFHKVK